MIFKAESSEQMNENEMSPSQKKQDRQTCSTFSARDSKLLGFIFKAQSREMEFTEVGP